MATILPVPESQWIDHNGNPLEAGTIETLVPGTSTPKPTWQDADSTILNTNPIVLDAAGRAIIYGSGIYRFIVRDSAGNLVYDQLTADTSTGGIASGGTSTGTPNAQVIAASSFTQQDGQAVEFIAGFTNTDAMTVAPGGGSGIPVLLDTAAGPVPLSGGEVVTDNAILLLYEAARGAFHLVNPTAGVITGGTINGATVINSTISTTQIDLDQATDPAPTAEGRIAWSTLFNTIKVGDGAGTQRFWGGAAPGAIAGCTISNNALDATNDIDFGAGTAADSTNAFYLTLGGGLTKRLDATWAVGNNQGGLFSGAAANASYHCFIIMRPDTGVTDCGFDTSPVAANRPASYTYFRRVGSIVRVGGAIKAFFQFDDYFFWSVQANDVNTTNPGTAAVTATLTVPTGIQVLAVVNFAIDDQSNNNTNYGLITSLSQADTAPGQAAFTVAWRSAGNANTFPATQAVVRTNTNGQVRYRLDYSDLSLAAIIGTVGFYDTRGR